MKWISGIHTELHIGSHNFSCNEIITYMLSLKEFGYNHTIWKKQSATVDPPWAPHTAAGEVLSLGDGNEDEHSLLSYCDVKLWQVPAGSLHSPSILFIFLLVLAHIVCLVNSLLCKPSPHFPIFNSLSSIPNLNLLLNTIRSGKNSKFIFFHIQTWN